MFLHSGLLHLLMNSLSFFLYLMPVESKLKNNLLFALVLLAGMYQIFNFRFGNLLSLNMAFYHQKRLLAVGASTAICSVIGFDLAYRILRVNNGRLYLRRIYITLAYLFFISLMPRVDFWGHFGALFAGFLLGLCFLKPGNFIRP